MYANPNVRLETLPLQKNKLNSPDFVTNRLFMKLCRTTDIRIISYGYVKNCLTLNCRVFSLNAVVKKFVNKFSAWCSI